MLRKILFAAMLFAGTCSEPVFAQAQACQNVCETVCSAGVCAWQCNWTPVCSRVCGLHRDVFGNLVYTCRVDCR